MSAMVTLLLSGWSFEPLVVGGCLIAALLYILGLRYSLRRGMLRRRARWRDAAFFGGLLTIIIALESPIDAWSEQLLWVHMLQHELLMMVAAPLLLLSAPLMPVWRAVPLGARRLTLRAVQRARWPQRLVHTRTHRRGTPVAVWLGAIGAIIAWHLPALYDLALEQQPAHDLEHLVFLGMALLFWSQVLPSPPLRPALSLTGRAVYLGAAALLSTALDEIFILALTPLYPYYAALPRPAGSISLLFDQSIAGGVMEGVGTGIFLLAIALLLRQSLRSSASPAGATGDDIAFAPR